MKIDQLPVEILMKIFSYLPRHEDILLVNKYFYDVACKVNDANIILRINTRFLVSKFFVVYFVLLIIINFDRKTLIGFRAS